MEWQIVGEDAKLTWVLVLTIPAAMFLLICIGGSLFIAGFLLGIHEKAHKPFQKKRVHPIRKRK